MPPDEIAGGHRFPTTRWSAITGFHSEDAAVRARSFELLAAAYWRPVYKYVRLKWRRSPSDAQDLTQGFFLRAMEKDFFAGYDSRKGRFRTWLRACLDGFVANEDKAARRLKRGGDAVILPLPFETAEGEIAAEPADRETPESCFDKEWTRSLFTLAVETLRELCEQRDKEIVFRIFERHDLDPPGDARVSYQELASEFGIPVTTVTNHLSLARREFRRLLLEKLREITVSDDEYRREAGALLGTDPTGPAKR